MAEIKINTNTGYKGATKVRPDGTIICPHCSTPLLKLDDNTYRCQGNGRLRYRFPPGSRLSIDKFGELSMTLPLEEVKEGLSGVTVKHVNKRAEEVIK